MKLIRDFESKKDKNQEERFQNTENFSLFFSTEKEIQGFDQWLPKNVKKFISLSQKSLENKIFFSKWNSNIEEFYQSNKISDIEVKEIIFDNNLYEIEIFNIDKLINEKTQEQLLDISFFLWNKLDDLEKVSSIFLINKAINTQLLSMKQLLIYLFLKGDNDGK